LRAEGSTPLRDRGEIAPRPLEAGAWRVCRDGDGPVGLP